MIYFSNQDTQNSENILITNSLALLSTWTAYAATVKRTNVNGLQRSEQNTTTSDIQRRELDFKSTM